MNAGSAWEAAEACREVGARLIFLSSEYVFDGRAGPYAEADATNPLSVYGLTKLLGEQATLDGGPDNLVVRSTVVFSHAPGEMNFLMQLAARLGRGERMKVPVDQVSSPTYAPALGEALAAVAERASGLLHVAGPEVMDRFTLARRVAARLGLDAGLLEPVTTADLGQPAARPLQAGLKVERLAGFRIRLPDLEEALGLVVAARSAPRAGLNPS
jgi:dTDP-4-dehydrorhamnose reductase